MLTSPRGLRPRSQGAQLRGLRGEPNFILVHPLTTFETPDIITLFCGVRKYLSYEKPEKINQSPKAVFAWEIVWLFKKHFELAPQGAIFINAETQI